MTVPHSRCFLLLVFGFLAVGSRGQHDPARGLADFADKAQGGEENTLKSNSSGASSQDATQQHIAPVPSVNLHTNGDKQGEAGNNEEADSNQNDSHGTKLPAEDCGGIFCEDDNKVVRTCLNTLDDGGYMILISVRNGVGAVDVKIAAPEVLKADKSHVLVKNGTNEKVTIMARSFKYAKMQDSKEDEYQNISVSSVHGKCNISIHVNNLEASRIETGDYGFYSYHGYSLWKPLVAGCLLLVLVCIVVGVLLLCKYCRKARVRDNAKYQLLEMNTLGTPKERERVVEGWDEMWDDDWEDTESAKSSSRLTQNLSSRGLAARRANKDGWDNSWKD